MRQTQPVLQVSILLLLSSASWRGGGGGECQYNRVNMGQEEKVWGLKGLMEVSESGRIKG